MRIKDSGCGIPADVLPRIFDPFFTTKEDQNRTGLGLAVAHSIVEQHAGDIAVRSAPGKARSSRCGCRWRQAPVRDIVKAGAGSA